MGFFSRLFGGKKERPKSRPTKPPSESPPLARESFAPAAFPFDGEVRVYHEDYQRLTTGWWSVSVGKPEEWQAKVDDMENALREHFGKFQTQDGRLVPRWSERTWLLVRKHLRVGHR